MAERRLDLIIRGRDLASRTLGRVGAALGGLARRAALAGTAITAGVVAGTAALTARSFEQIDAVAKLGDRIGENIDTLRGLQLANTFAGGSAEQLASAIDVLTKRIGEARQGTGQALIALEELGLKAEDLADDSPSEALLKIADAIKALPDAQQRAAVTSQLLSRANQNMVNLLQQGSAAIREQIDESTRLRGSLSRIDAAGVEAVNDEWARFKATLSGVGDRIAVEAAEPIERLIERATQFVSQTLPGLIEGVAGAVSESVGEALSAIEALEEARRVANRADAQDAGPAFFSAENFPFTTAMVDAISRAAGDAIAGPVVGFGPTPGAGNRSADAQQRLADEWQSQLDTSRAISRGAYEIQQELDRISDQLALAANSRRMLDDLDPLIRSRLLQAAERIPAAVIDGQWIDEIAERARQQAANENVRLFGETFSERDTLDEIFARSRADQFGGAAAALSRATPAAVQVTDRFTGAAERFRGGQDHLRRLVDLQQQDQATQRQIADNTRRLLELARRGGGIPLNLGGA